MSDECAERPTHCSECGECPEFDAGHETGFALGFSTAARRVREAVAAERARIVKELLGRASDAMGCRADASEELAHVADWVEAVP